MSAARRIKVKDGIFKMQFSFPEHCAELINFVSGASVSPSEIKQYQAFERKESVVTVDDVSYSNIPDDSVRTPLRNDLCVKVRNNLLVFVEAQSTYPHNMPLRMLRYATEILSLEAEEQGGVFCGRTLKLPAPEFCVVCTGPAPAGREMRLSEQFTNTGKLELRVKVVDAAVCAQRSPKSLEDYMFFCDTYDDVRKVEPDVNRAIEEVARICLAKGKMERLITERWKEFRSAMTEMFIDWNHDERLKEEYLKKGREEGRREGRQEGIERGVEEGASVMLRLIQQGMTPEEAANKVKQSLNKDGQPSANQRKLNRLGLKDDG